MLCRVMLRVPHQTTYYSDTEYERLQELADEKDVSFSNVVRTAIQEYYEL